MVLRFWGVTPRIFPIKQVLLTSAPVVPMQITLLADHDTEAGETAYCGIVTAGSVEIERAVPQGHVATAVDVKGECPAPIAVLSFPSVL